MKVLKDIVNSISICAASYPMCPVGILMVCH